MKIDPKMMKQLGLAMVVGSQFLGSIISGVFVGWVFDHYGGTDPFGLLVGSFLGLGVGIRWLVQYQNKIQG
jgi:ATP synthase protein I